MADSAYYDPILKGEWVRDAQGRYIHPITKQPVTQDQYLQTAYTPNAIGTREDLVKRSAAQTFYSQPKSAVESLQYMQANNLTPEQLASYSGKPIEEIFPTVYDHEGRGYRADQLLKLAAQAGENFNTNDSQGGVYKTSEEGIGFDYSTIKSLFPNNINLSAAEQIMFDMARGALNMGVTDLNKLKSPVSTIPTGRGGAFFCISTR